METKKINNSGDKIEIGTPNFFSFGRTETGTPLVAEFFGRNKWIDYGKNNDYPQELIRLFQNASSIHSSILKRKADMIAGNGFNPVSGLTEFLDNEYGSEHLDNVAYKTAFDLALFGGYYLKVIWNKKGKIAQIEHMPLEKVRIEKPCTDEEVDEIRGFYVSPDWIAWKITKREEYKPKCMAAFDPKDYKSNPEQLFYVRAYCPGMDYYTIPSYSSAINWIKLDYEISTFHLKNVQNGFMPGMIIVNKMGIPPAHMREQEYQELKKRYSSAENAGDFIMVYAESAEKAPDFLPVQLNNSDQKFKDLSEQINNEIMRVHNFTPAIAGVEVSGKLGSKNELQEQLEMLQLTVIRPFQKIVEDGFQKLAEINDYDEKLELKEYKIFKESESSTLDTLNNLNPTILAKLLETMTSDELRIMLGIPSTILPESPVTETQVDSEEPI